MQKKNQKVTQLREIVNFVSVIKKKKDFQVVVYAETESIGNELKIESMLNYIDSM